MCQPYEAMCHPYEAPNLTQHRCGSADVAPWVATYGVPMVCLWCAYGVPDASKRVMSDSFCDAGCGQQPKQVRGQRACKYYLWYALRLLAPRATSQGKLQPSPFDPVDPGPPKSEPCNASTSCVSPRLRRQRACAASTSCGSSGILRCSQHDGSLSQQAPR